MAERSSFEGSAVPEPSPAARELLRAFREHESPSAAERDLGFDALRDRLEHETILGGLSGSSPSTPKVFEPSPAANGRLYTIVRATLVTVAVAAAVLLVIKAIGSGVTALADRARQPAMEAPYQGEAGADGGQAVSRAPRVLPPRRGAASPADASGAAGAEAGAIEPEAAVLEPSPGEPAPSSSAGRPSRSRPAVTPDPATADDLQAELALIKRATEAKAAGRFADGLAALREHARRFPNGVMTYERMVLKAELYCASGRVQEADALVESFLREHPGHSLTGRMRNVCRE